MTTTPWALVARGTATTRYRVMLDLILPTPSPVTLLDFGCGVSHLYEYAPRSLWSAHDVGHPHASPLHPQRPGGEGSCASLKLVRITHRKHPAVAAGHPAWSTGASSSSSPSRTTWPDACRCLRHFPLLCRAVAAAPPPRPFCARPLAPGSALARRLSALACEDRRAPPPTANELRAVAPSPAGRTPSRTGDRITPASSAMRARASKRSPASGRPR